MPERILGRDGDGEGRAGGRRGRGTDGEGSHRRAYRDGGARPQQFTGHGIQRHGVRGIEGHHDGGRTIDQTDRSRGEVDRLLVAAGEGDLAVIVRHGVAGRVAGRDGDREGDAGDGRGRSTDGERGEGLRLEGADVRSRGTRRSALIRRDAAGRRPGGDGGATRQQGHGRDRAPVVPHRGQQGVERAAARTNEVVVGIFVRDAGQATADADQVVVAADDARNVRGRGGRVGRDDRVLQDEVPAGRVVDAAAGRRRVAGQGGIGRRQGAEVVDGAASAGRGAGAQTGDRGDGRDRIVDQRGIGDVQAVGVIDGSATAPIGGIRGRIARERRRAQGQGPGVVNGAAVAVEAGSDIIGQRRLTYRQAAGITDRSAVTVADRDRRPIDRSLRAGIDDVAGAFFQRKPGQCDLRP